MRAQNMTDPARNVTRNEKIKELFPVHRSKVNHLHSATIVYLFVRLFV